MDTQISGAEDAEGEWAVERIRSHSGSGTDALFEIEWKSGDITWLPYYQITHLQALTDYLDLLGLTQITQLPRGTGRPPSDDPQIFLGSIAPSLVPSSIFCFPLQVPILSHVLSYLTRPLRTLFFNPPHSFTSITLDLELLTFMPPSSHPGVNHPRFTRISATQYVMKDPANYYATTLHVGHIVEILKFDEQVCLDNGIHHVTGIPLGFAEFSDIWNTGAHPKDPCRVSKVFVTDNPDEHFVEAATVPISIQDFHITPEQAGAAHDAVAPSGIQAEITQEFAAIMLRRQQNFRRGYEERQNRHTQSFEAGQIGAGPKRATPKHKKSTQTRTEISTIKPAASGLETSNAGPSSTTSPVDSTLAPMETTI